MGTQILRPNVYRARSSKDLRPGWKMYIYIYGKLLIQSLEWLLHNFSETSHFTDHAKKQLGKSLLQHANFMVTEFRTEFTEDY